MAEEASSRSISNKTLKCQTRQSVPIAVCVCGGGGEHLSLTLFPFSGACLIVTTASAGLQLPPCSIASPDSHSDPLLSYVPLALIRPPFSATSLTSSAKGLLSKTSCDSDSLSFSNVTSSPSPKTEVLGSVLRLSSCLVDLPCLAAAAREQCLALS